MVYDFNEQPIVSSLYVARRLDLPPLTALAAFNAQRDAACAGETAKRYLVETPGARLRVMGSCGPTAIAVSGLLFELTSESR